jgi:hypothetical protein
MKMTKQPLVLLQSLTKTSALSLVNTRWFSESSRSKMKIIETVEEFHAIRRKLPSGVTLGFVPTMGVSVKIFMYF